MEAKVVNTSLLGYQSAAREEDRESEGEREADFPRAQCKVGINSAIARAAPPLKHREGRSVRGQRSEAGEGAQERRDGGRQWWCKGMGGGGGGVGLTVLNSDVCEAEAGLREAERREWGGWGGGGGERVGGCPERSEVQCCRAALGSPND